VPAKTLKSVEKLDLPTQVPKTEKEPLCAKSKPKPHVNRGFPPGFPRIENKTCGFIFDSRETVAHPVVLGFAAFYL